MKTLLALILSVLAYVGGCSPELEKVYISCPGKEPIETRKCYPTGVTPTDYQAFKIISEAYKHYVCEEGCIRVLGKITKTEKGLCLDLTKTDWLFESEIECAQFPVPKDKEKKEQEE